MSLTRSRLLIYVTLIPIAALFALAAFDVPLGKPGKFTYLYSPFYLIRALRLPWLVPLAALAWFALRAPSRRAAPFWLMFVAVVAIAIWNFLAPPRYVSQHAFNFVSPSHDGAFVLEADKISDLSAYLQAFPEYVLSDVATKKGTRVASNPPAMTWLAYHIFEAFRANRAWMRLTPLAERGADALVLQAGFLLAYALQIGWVLAFMPWYFAARRFVAPHVAAALAFCVMVSPMTILFAPGKDTAQLLTVGIMVWLWPIAMRATDANWRTHSRSMLAGASLAVFAMIGLIHFWIAMVLVSAGLLPILFASLRSVKNAGASAPRLAQGVRMQMLRREGLRLVGGVAGLVIGVFALQAISAIDWLATVRAVAEAQARVTRGTDAMPLLWQLLGIPLFLLFCGPAVWWALLCGRCGEPLSRENASSPTPQAPKGGANFKPQAPARGSRDVHQREDNNREKPDRNRERSHAEPTSTESRASLEPGAGGSNVSGELACGLGVRFAGRWLFGIAVVAMISTVGFTNVETPRLWIPFAALVLFAGFVCVFSEDGGVVRESVSADGGFRCALPILQRQSTVRWLVVAQIAASGMVWCAMDMREAEHRLIGGDDARLFSSVDEPRGLLGFAALYPSYKIYQPTNAAKQLIHRNLGGSLGLPACRLKTCTATDRLFGEPPLHAGFILQQPAHFAFRHLQYAEAGHVSK